MKFLEKWNQFLLMEDVGLLIEGRKENAMKGLLKKIEDEELMEWLTRIGYPQILEADITPDKKYIEWTARRVNAYVIKVYNNIIAWEGGPDMDEIRKLAKKSPTGTELHDMSAKKHTAIVFRDAMRAGNKTAYENLLEDIITATRRRIQSVGESMPSYIKLVNRNLIEKNIESFGDLDDFTRAVREGMSELNRREQVKAMEKQAKDESEIIVNNNDVMIVRPYTALASTCWGKSEVGVTWCISASESRNYFDQYTGEGVGFYFVFMKHLPKSSDNKKLALVYKPGDDFHPSEVFDRPDQEYDSDHVYEVARENVLAGALKRVIGDQLQAIKGPAKNRRREEHYNKEYEVMMSRYQNLIQADLSVGTVKDRIEGGILEKVFKALGIEDAEEFEEYVDEATSDLSGEIMGDSGGHWQDNPAGPTEAEFDKVLEDAGLQHIHVSIEDYDGEGRLYWTGYASWDFSQEDDLSDDVDTDVIRDLLSDACNDNYVYPDELSDNSYNNSVEFYANFNADHGEHEGLEGFKSFVERMSEADAAYEKIYNETVDKMKDSGIIHGESFASTKEAFEALDLELYDVDVEDGQIILSTRFHTKLLLPEEIYGDRTLKGDDEESRKHRLASHEAYRALGILMSDPSNIENFLLSRVRGRFEQAFQRMYDQLGRQMRLDLKEDKDEIKVPVWDMKMGSVGPQKQGSIPDGQMVGSKEYAISDVWVYWFDVVVGTGTKSPEELLNLQRFMKLVDKKPLHEKMRQHVEAFANRMLRFNLQKVKEAYQKSISGQTPASQVTFEVATIDQALDSAASLQKLVEGWRKRAS
jgi:hypothetical protein